MLNHSSPHTEQRIVEVPLHEREDALVVLQGGQAMRGDQVHGRLVETHLRLGEGLPDRDDPAIGADHFLGGKATSKKTE